MGAQVFTVPLKADGSHDVKAMVAASPTAGAYYIVNPNNPTGTMTPKEDIVWLLNNKPAGSVVVVDEAYHHFSNDESSIDLVAADKDIIILRTFSKVYGMAGLRAGFFIAKPEYQAKLGKMPAGTVANGSGIVSITTPPPQPPACRTRVSSPPAARSTPTSVPTFSSGWTRTAMST